MALHTIQLDPARWTYADFNDFIKAVVKVDYDKALHLATQLIVEWSYVDENDEPLAIEAYDELPFPELRRIMDSVNTRINDYIKALDHKVVTVNLDRWKIKDFLDWQAASRTGDIERMEKHMKTVCTLEGVEAEARLSLTQGALMAAAIRAAQKEVYGRGN